MGDAVERQQSKSLLLYQRAFFCGGGSDLTGVTRDLGLLFYKWRKLSRKSFHHKTEQSQAHATQLS